MQVLFDDNIPLYFSDAFKSMLGDSEDFAEGFIDFQIKDFSEWIKYGIHLSLI